MEMETNNNMMFQEEKKGGSGTWVWWLIALLIILGILWLVFGGKKANGPDTSEVTGVNIEDYGDDVEFDEHGLPILGPAAPISAVRVETSQAFPVQATLIVTGDLPNGCTYLNNPAQVRDGNVFYVTLSTRVEGDTCTEALVPYERRIELNVAGLPAGSYTVNVNGQATSFELAQVNALNFEAGSDK